jgi:hypothetical protein
VRKREERFWSRVIPFLYPALKPLYNKHKRRDHYYAFKKTFTAEVGRLGFWKNLEDELKIELRFTSNEDYTLAFVDFLDTRLTKDAFDRTTLPLTLLIGGDGSFSKPF